MSEKEVFITVGAYIKLPTTMTEDEMRNEAEDKVFVAFEQAKIEHQVFDLEVRDV